MTVDEELKDIQLKTAKIDLQLKQLDFERRHSFWRDVLASPPILAVAITACITVGSATISAISTGNQARLEQQRAASQALAAQTNFNDQMKMNILLGTINSGTDCAVGKKLKLLLDVGLLTDDPGDTLHKASAMMSGPKNCDTP